MLEDTAGPLKRVIKDELILVDMARAAASKRGEDLVYVRAGAYLIGFARDSFALTDAEASPAEEVLPVVPPVVPLNSEDELMEIPAVGIEMLPSRWYEGVTIAPFTDRSIINAKGFVAGRRAYIRWNDFSLKTKAPSWQVIANLWAWHINAKQAELLVRAVKVADKQDALERRWKHLWGWAVRT